MYFTYLAHVLIKLVHVMKIMSNGLEGNYYDVSSSISNIFLHFIAFIVSYGMGISLNSAHHDNHQKMIDAYLGVEIKTKDAHYLCKQGNYIKEIIEEDGTGADTEKASLLTKSDKELHDLNNKKIKEELEEVYKKYFEKAMSMQAGAIVTKKDEFNFIPSFWGITIPLGSHGYTFAVLLTVVSIVMNFLR